MDYRLNVSSIQGGRLVSERSFDLADPVVRTAALDDDRSLVFGDSSMYLADRRSGSWNLTTVREFYVPVASYRVDDADLYAVVSTIGSRCRIDTHRADAAVFDEAHLGQLDLPCGDGAMGIGPNIVFAQTATGVAIAPDGSLRPLDAAAVDALVATRAKGACWLEGKPSGRPVEWLDTIPAKIFCKEE